jgi:sugar phosphate isomerase/epimerase
MRIACSTFSFDRDFRAGSLDIAGFLNTCGAVGLDAVELNGGYLMRDSIGTGEIKRLAVQLALDVCALAIETVVYVGDQDGATAYKDKMLDWLEVCAALGAPILRVNTAQPGNGMHEVPAGVSEQQVRTWAIQAFREVAATAREKGILLAMENHYGLTRTSTDILAFIADLEQDNVGVNIDTGNFWDSPYQVKAALESGSDASGLVPFEEPYAGIECLAPHMVFSHCKIYGLTADGENDRVLDYDRILRTYVNCGYRGYLSIENFTDEDPSEVVSRSARMLRRRLEGAVEVGAG